MNGNEAGVEAPNYTQLPNAVLDSMHEMSDPELRVTLAIARQTFGWHKQSDDLSISQLMKLTGLSNTAVIDGIDRGVKRGTIRKVAKDKGNPRRGYTYSLLVKETHKPYEPEPQALVSDDHIQKKGKETNQKKTDNGVADTTPPPAPSANLPLASDGPQPKTTKDGASKMPLGGTPSPGSAPPPPSAKKGRRIKSEFYDHPFVAVWRDVFRLNLPEAKMVQLAKEIVTPPKLAQWRAACEAWVLRPYDPSNIGGILDWYRDPSRYQNHQLPRRGQNPVVPQTPYKPKSQAEIDEYLANSPIIED